MRKTKDSVMVLFLKKIFSINQFIIKEKKYLPLFWIQTQQFRRLFLIPNTKIIFSGRSIAIKRKQAVALSFEMFVQGGKRVSMVKSKT